MISVKVQGGETVTENFVSHPPYLSLSIRYLYVCLACRTVREQASEYNNGHREREGRELQGSKRSGLLPRPETEGVEKDE